jgi:imidazolonepropionase-like amidohydrolase
MNLLNGADFIGVNVGGAVGSNIPLALETNDWTQEELDAAADEARRRGVMISADNCYVDELIGMCAKAGFDGIIHGGLVSERGLEILARHNMFIVPTLSVFDGYVRPEAERHFPRWRVLKGRRVAEMQRKTFPKYIEMGVNVVGGSFGRIAGEDNLELQLMVEYGMNPMQAIVAHTKKGAEVIRMSDRLGTLEVGKLADLVVVDGDPLADIKILQNRKKIQLVMKGGEIFRSDL